MPPSCPTINNRLADYSQNIAGLYSLASCYVDSLYSAVNRSNDLVLHLHSLENENYFASLYSLANRCYQLNNLAWHWCINSGLASCRCCCWSGWCCRCRSCWSWSCYWSRSRCCWCLRSLRSCCLYFLNLNLIGSAIYSNVELDRKSVV